MDVLPSLQSIAETLANLSKELQFMNELHRLRTSLHTARMLIFRSEWGMSKDKNLAELLSHLKDTTYDAEDHLRVVDDQALRQRIEDADRNRAGQLLSCYLNIAKSLFHRTKTRIKETQDKLDKAVADIEKALSLMGLTSIDPSQMMPETSSIISAPEVVGRDDERDDLINKLGVTIGREAQRDQVISQLGVPLIGGDTRAAGTNGKRASTSNGGVASTCRAKQPRGNSGRAGLVPTNCTSNVSVISIVGIGGVGKTTLAQFIYNDPRVERHFRVMIWVCVSDFFDKRRITKEIIESLPRIPGKEFDPSCSLNALQKELRERLKICPKFLLVLDDVWPNAKAEWEAFYAPLRCLYCVGSEEEASEARLVEKQYLKELVLQWRQGLVYKLVSSENGVLEGLRPHPRIECLKFIGFSGDRLPSWFKPEDMPFLRSLELSSCGPLESLSIPFHAGFSGDMLRSSLDVEQENILRILERIDSIINRGNGIVSSAFTRLAALRVYRCWKLRDLEQFLTPENLPCIESIILEDCWNLKSIPIHSFEGFDCLCDLKICRYHELKWPREMVLPYSLQRLCIVSSKLDMSFPACLENLTSLTLLQLGSCDNIRCIPLNLICSNTLKCLAIRDCQDLSSIGGLHALASIQHVQISSCPYLDEVQQPFEKKELQTKEEKEPLKFLDS
nr:unnamed protein product [Digitaria exilis]